MLWTEQPEGFFEQDTNRLGKLTKLLTQLSFKKNLIKNLKLIVNERFYGIIIVLS